MKHTDTSQISKAGAFLIIFRFCFVFYSVIFAMLAADKWGKYSFFMKFQEFLPDLSLSFIFWTVFPLSYALAIWIVSVSASGLSVKIFPSMKLEQIIIIIFLIIFPLYIKQNYFSDISVSDLFGLSRSYVLLIGGILVVLIVWLTRIHSKKILYSLDKIIDLIVWFLFLMFLLAIPISIFMNKTSQNENLSNNKVFASSEISGKPNIIVISWDTLTALDMQLYGYERNTTPFISEWSKDAAVFNRAYSPSNWTTPVIFSLMTSQRPWTHRIWHQAAYSPIDDFKNNLPALLNDHGYECYSYVQTKHANPEALGMKNAFSFIGKHNTLHLPYSSWYERFIEKFIERPVFMEWFFGPTPPVPISTIRDIFSHEYSSTLYPPEIIYNRFLQHLSERTHKQELNAQARPFFAFLHLRPPHQPYLPPKPFLGSFNKSNKYNTDVSQYASFNFYEDYNDNEQKNVDILRARYDEFILYSDSQFKQFIGELSETIDLTNTIIIFTADHGESFSHNYLAHRGPDLYEPLVHVPLIIKIPQGIDKDLKMNGNTFNMPVETIDIAPTILKLADIPVPDWMEGRVLTHLTEDEYFQPEPVYSMRLTDNSAFDEHITKGTVAVWDGDYKLVHYLEEEKSLLFDLASDPDELTNISHEKPEITQRLLLLIKDNIEKSDITHSELY